jgi:hypothetical protein
MGQVRFLAHSMGAISVFNGNIKLTRTYKEFFDMKKLTSFFIPLIVSVLFTQSVLAVDEVVVTGYKDTSTQSPIFGLGNMGLAPATSNPSYMNQAAVSSISAAQQLAYMKKKECDKAKQEAPLEIQRCQASADYTLTAVGAANCKDQGTFNPYFGFQGNYALVSMYFPSVNYTSMGGCLSLASSATRFAQTECSVTSQEKVNRLCEGL